MPAALVASLEGVQDVGVVNLSPGGAMVLHLNPLVCGAAHVLSLAPGGTEVRLPVRVVWSRLFRAQPDPYQPPRSGVRFGLRHVDLPAATERALCQYLDTLRPAG